MEGRVMCLKLSDTFPSGSYLLRGFFILNLNKTVKRRRKNIQMTSSDNF